MQGVEEVGVVGHLQRALDAHEVAPCHQGRLLVTGDPHGLAQGARRAVGQAHDAHVGERVPPERTGARILTQRGLDLDPIGRERGERRRAQPHLREHGPGGAERGDAGADEQGHGDGRCAERSGRRAHPHQGRRGRSRAGHQIGDRVAVADRGRGDRRRDERGEPQRARRPGGKRPAGAEAQQQAQPPRGGRRRQQPGGHTVTWSRISSRVAGPMPLTLSRSSTEANGPVLGAVVDDGPGEHLADARERLELGGARRVDVHQAAGGAASGLAGHRARGSRALLRHHDLGAVGERRRQVQHAQVGAVAGAPGALDRVDHALALGELVHTGLVHPAGDVDDDRRTRRRGRGARHDTGGGRGRRRWRPRRDRDRLRQRPHVPQARAGHGDGHDHDETDQLASRQRLEPFPDAHAARLRSTRARFRDGRHARGQVSRSSTADVLASTHAASPRRGHRARRARPGDAQPRHAARGAPDGRHARRHALPADPLRRAVRRPRRLDSHARGLRPRRCD